MEQVQQTQQVQAAPVMGPVTPVVQVAPTGQLSPEPLPPSGTPDLTGQPAAPAPIAAAPVVEDDSFDVLEFIFSFG